MIPPERNLPEYLQSLLKTMPKDQPNFESTLIASAMEQAGVLPILLRRNPELAAAILQFFQGRTRILVVGGESGMGKSLLASDVRRLHQDLQLLPFQEMKSTLCVITWDRTHQAFFEEMSTEIGGTLFLPPGETHPKARKLVSKILADEIMFAKKYLGEDVRIIVEAPLIDQRGETIFEELTAFADEVTTLIMHSPSSRDETLSQGRLLATSGQSDAMNQMRERLLERLLGSAAKQYSQEARDELIRRWWIEQLTNWRGIVVEWDPNDDRAKFTETVEYYKSHWLRPDVLSPKSLSRFTRKQLEAIFLTLDDIDGFIWEVTR